MNDNILKIRTLVDRFFDGETTLDEEQQLYAYFRAAHALPADLEPLRQMFLDLAVAQAPHPATIALQKKAFPWRHWAAAAIAALVVGAAVTVFSLRSQSDEEYVAYIYGERTTDRAVVLNEMQKTMTALAATDGTDIVEEQLKSMFAH